MFPPKDKARGWTGPGKGVQSKQTSHKVNPGSSSLTQHGGDTVLLFYFTLSLNPKQVSTGVQRSEVNPGLGDRAPLLRAASLIPSLA